jgi:hypothetical protein
VYGCGWLWVAVGGMKERIVTWKTCFSSLDVMTGRRCVCTWIYSINSMSILYEFYIYCLSIVFQFSSTRLNSTQLDSTLHRLYQLSLDCINCMHRFPPPALSGSSLPLSQSHLSRAATFPSFALPLLDASNVHDSCFCLLTLTHSHTLTSTHTHTLSLTLSLPHTLTLCLSHSHTHSLPHTLFKSNATSIPS